MKLKILYPKLNDLFVGKVLRPELTNVALFEDDLLIGVKG